MYLDEHIIPTAEQSLPDAEGKGDERQENHSLSTQSLYPKKTVPRHRALMRRLVSGIPLKDACEDLGYTVSRASLIVHSPLFQEEMKVMEREVKGRFVEAEGERTVVDVTRETLVEASEKAARTLEGALDCDSVQARISAAKDILDRTGYDKEDKIKVQTKIEPSQAFVDVVNRIARNESK